MPRRTRSMAKLADIDDSEDEKESKNDDKDEDYKPSVEDDVQDADESGPSTSATRSYIDYDGTFFPSLIRYRTPTDIVAQTIVQSQANGVDRYEIGKYLMTNSKTKSGNRRVSALIQQVVKTYPDEISQFQKMEGKIRILKYFYKDGESTPSSFLELLEKLEALTGQKFPYCCSDIVQFPGKNLSSLRISDITLRRFLFILEFLKQEDVIVLVWRLSRYISKNETELGYQFSIDKKSVMKCLYALEQKNLLRVFKMDNVYGENQNSEGDSPANTIQVVVPYEIENTKDPRITAAVNRVISELNEEGRLFPTGQYLSGKATTSNSTSDGAKSKKVTKKKNEIDSSIGQSSMTVEERYKFMRYSFDSVRKKTNSTGVEEEGEYETEEVNYGYQSKLIRCAILHEFIYHVVYELEADEKIPSLHDRFKLTRYLDANKTCTPLENLPVVDPDPNSPYRHVVRIPPFQNIQRGWFMVRDVLQGMPLCIFVLLVKPKRRVEGLQEILDDPEKRNIPLADLPINMRKQLFNRQSSLVIEYLCLILSAMGLMKVAPPHEGKLNTMGPHAMFFCGKKAYFYDTSTTARGYALVTPPITQYPRYEHVFDSMENIHQYWCHLKAVCWSTSLGARNLAEGQEDGFKSDSRKYAQGTIDRAPLTANYDVEIDQIDPVGNNDGCAGLDAQLFTHLQRNWELNTQPGSSSTDWFLKRWQHTSARLSSYVSERVCRLEKNWNSYITTFLPTDLDLAKKKKTELPILTQKTLDSLSGNFRRHHNTKRILATQTGVRKIAAKKKSTLASINSIIIETVETTSKPKKKPVKRKAETEESEMNDSSKKRSGAKRKPDAIDEESKKLNMNLRSRFSSNEYDMLVLIRSISYFLNPIHRFWLNPTVMRDIMHMHVPESRCKTVSSLLAASAREMLRPGRSAQLQYIVKTFSSDKKMIEIRDKLAIACKTDDEKNNVFWQAFRTAYKLIFDEANQVPEADVSDTDFQKYLNKKKLTISLADSSICGFPRRSRKPQTVEDVQHCVAYNVVMSTLISEVCRSGGEEEDTPEKNLIRSDCLINSISPAVLSETLEICRADGLVTKIRNNEAKMYMNKNQVTVSIYYRHFFNHFYRKDLIDLQKDVITKPNLPGISSANEDNPAALLHMIDYSYSDVNRFNLNLARITDLIDCNLIVSVEDETKDQKLNAAATKNVRQLESAPMRIENIGIEFSKIADEFIGGVPSREEVLPIICPVFKCQKIEDPTELKNELAKQLETHPVLKGKINLSKATDMINCIKETDFNGATIDELEKMSQLDEDQLRSLLELFAQLSIAFPCGVDIKRYVAVDNSLPWLIKTDMHRFSARPWTLPNGSVNWPILRWMSESLIMTIYSKAGILIDELVLLYSCVLSPVLVHELVDFLVALGCCSIEKHGIQSTKLKNPFETDDVYMENSKNVQMKPHGLNKFAIFFASTQLPEQLLHKKT